MDIRAELTNPALSDEEVLLKFLHLDKIPPWAYEVAKEPDFTLVNKEKKVVVEDFIEKRPRNLDANSGGIFMAQIPEYINNK